MGFQETINEIFKGLSGDNEKDLKYLKDQMDKHKDQGIRQGDELSPHKEGLLHLYPYPYGDILPHRAV